MQYIISGMHRSGTSMMMKCLIDGGIKPIWCADREERMALNDTDDYIVNPSGFWEVGQKNYMKFGYTASLPDECCVKIQAKGLPILSSGDYKIIFMRRNPEEIKASYIKIWGQEQWNASYINWPKYYYELTNNVIDIMTQRRDVDLIEIQYNDVVDHPLATMLKLVDSGLPIDPIEAAKVPNPDYRRNEVA